MEIKKIGAKFKQGETRLGTYVWEMPDGRWVGDDEGNFLSILAMRDDRVKVNMLVDAVRGYGIYEGQPLFLEGRRKIDDEEFEYQKQRLNWGLTPDPLDIGVYKDSLKEAKRNK